MATKAKVNHPTLGLPEALEPPPGHWTTAALGTTYSVDLIACMSALIALDGGDTERERHGRLSTVRALQRLRGSVLVAAQAGRIAWQGSKNRSALALLDQVICPVQLPGHLQSLHAKVWLVRQEAEGAVRYVLVVSSRNLTSSQDWDLGVAVSGCPGSEGVPLPRLGDFIERIAALTRRPDWPARFPELATVRWRLPDGAQRLAFDFQAGDELSAPHPGLDALPAGRRVLLLSPFLDVAMVKECARRFGAAGARRLVAGDEWLSRVWQNPAGRAALASLCPHQMGAAKAGGTPTPDAPLRDEEAADERGLHAKVLCVDDGATAHLIIGSGNLTRNGWLGGNCEAFIALQGPATLADLLWGWTDTRAVPFQQPSDDAPVPSPPAVEQARDALCGAALTLREPTGGPAVLQAPIGQLLLGHPAVDLMVARFTRPGDPVPWPPGAAQVELSAVPLAQRTRFILMTVRDRADPDQSRTWVESATVEPDLDEERDREVCAQLLGVRRFLELIRLVADGTDEDDDEVDDAADGRDGDGWSAQGPGRGEGAVSLLLEDLLRDLLKDPRRRKDVDALVAQYGRVFQGHTLSDEERRLLSDFLALWGAVTVGLTP